jgi:hypothetical protein
MTNSPTIEYFGMETVEKAIADFFSKHGVTEDVRDYLMALEIEDADGFFQLVENYVERK